MDLFTKRSFPMKQPQDIGWVFLPSHKRKKSQSHFNYYTSLP